MRKYTLTENLVFDADIFETCTECISHEIAEDTCAEGEKGAK